MEYKNDRPVVRDRVTPSVISPFKRYREFRLTEHSNKSKVFNFCQPEGKNENRKVMVPFYPNGVEVLLIGPSVRRSCPKL